MATRLLCCLLTVLAVSMPVYSATNLVVNPGFETGVASPWASVSAPQGPTQEHAHSGLWGWRIQGARASQTITMAPLMELGDLYRAKFWLRFNDPTGPTAFMRFGLFNSLAQRVSSEIRIFADGHVETISQGGILLSSEPGPSAVGTWVQYGADLEITSPQAGQFPRLIAVNQGSLTAWVDDFEMYQGTEGDVVAYRKWSVVDSLITRLKGITGSGAGFRSNVGGRVYTRLIPPDEARELAMPYLCVPFDGRSGKFQPTQSYKHIEIEWDQMIYGYVGETGTSAIDSVAVQSVADLEDDIIKALANGGALPGVRNWEFVDIESVAGMIPEDSFAEISLMLRLKSIFQPSDLGV